MKKYLLFILLLPTILLAQKFVEYPSTMISDTLYSSTRVTRDYWFNDRNARGFQTINSGAVDIDIYPTMASSVAGTDTLTIEAYGLKYKKIAGTDYTMAGDSVRLGIVEVDTLLHSFILEDAYTTMGLIIPMIDGIRLVFKKGGSDADSTNVYSNSKQAYQ
jgi:hypothetical protein